MLGFPWPFLQCHSPNTKELGLLPSLRALLINFPADLLITWTTKRGQFTAFAMEIALCVASASTSSGRDSACPSGPVIPIASIFFAPWTHTKTCKSQIQRNHGVMNMLLAKWMLNEPLQLVWEKKNQNKQTKPNKQLWFFFQKNLSVCYLKSKMSLNNHRSQNT